MARLRAVPPGEPFVIVATGKYVGEGFDEPRLDTLFLAAPISWSGTLQQYAGRLHRDYPGKQNVTIYDYADIHARPLEGMYHKRIKGYVAMGYRVQSAAAPEQTNCIFDSKSYLTAFDQDIRAAQHEIIIACPYLKKQRVIQLLRLISPLQINGVRTVIITRPAGCYKPAGQPSAAESLKMLTEYGAQVRELPDAQQRFAVIDQSVVWYGSVNFLGYSGEDCSVMRLVNADVAEELAGDL